MITMELSSLDTTRPPENESDLVIFDDDGTGQLRQQETPDLAAFLSSSRHYSTQVIFTKHGLLQESPDLAKLPADFRRTFEADLNGSFHNEYIFNGNEMTNHVSWSMFKIKLVKSPIAYKWLEPSIFVDWDIEANRQRIFFVDVPSTQRKQIVNKFPTQNMRDRNPYIWHAVFAHEIAHLYETSFWNQRDVIRNVEKLRNASSKNLPIFLKGLNDSARHAVHLNETMEVADHTMNRLLAEHVRWRSEFQTYVSDGEANAIRCTYLQTDQKLAFVGKEIHSTRVRAKTLTDRLASEIQLANTLVSHEMSKHTRYDSMVMRTLSFVGMIYLPGTFVSGIYGSNFFDFQSGEKESWEMSHEFWQYWAVTIPLTLATFVVWALWHYRAKLGFWRKGKQDENNMV
ncbi:uncharacterized protein BDW43DRAFT_266935 [Aspergillus alliaceus]|uniref:uncharacterized protein n=1 Tax=Petromyces alliaceus TaxID=209559 RepID=UPI0012A45EE9|nr:uncharacterized protein BDW43DRAFT_266935 [Aspergillus alliaceus]KAB8236446.1 hypothetical protein BDW43DRAFT_266935 [Aspergillus alliaceus]